MGAAPSSALTCRRSLKCSGAARGVCGGKRNRNKELAQKCFEVRENSSSFLLTAFSNNANQEWVCVKGEGNVSPFRRVSVMVVSSASLYV